MKYAWIQAQGRLWPISTMCQVLDVSESGYYHHYSHVSTRQHVNDTALLTHIRAIHAQVEGEYGWPRMRKALQANGIKVSQRARTPDDEAKWHTSARQG